MNNNLLRILSCSLLLLAWACQKNVEVVREEYIRFYSDADRSKEIDVLQIPFEGDTAKIIIKTNNAVNIKYDMPQIEGQDPWITFSEPVLVSEGEYEVSYVAAHLEKDIEQRVASVNVTAPTIWLGRFLKVCQGYEPLWAPSAAIGPITYRTPWQSSSIAGIGDLSNAYLSFNAYVVSQSERDPEETFQFAVEVSEGAVFTDTGLSSYVVDIQQGEEFNWSNIVTLPFKASDTAFREDTKVTLKLVKSTQGLTVHVDNFRIYNVTEDLVGDGDGEEWEDPEAGELEDLE